ncbi:hypothetical protein V8F20_002394 [Naviculisporaceae sp. PSN 640]
MRAPRRYETVMKTDIKRCTKLDEVRMEWQAKHPENPLANTEEMDAYCLDEAQAILRADKKFSEDQKLETYRVDVEVIRLALSEYPMPFMRVILDKGHLAKNTRTAVARTVGVFPCAYKHIITATPTLNSVDDFASIAYQLRRDVILDIDSRGW